MPIYTVTIHLLIYSREKKIMRVCCMPGSVVCARDAEGNKSGIGTAFMLPVFQGSDFQPEWVCPLGDSGTVWNHGWLSQLGQWQGYWHLVGRGRNAAKHPHCMGQSPQPKIIQPKVPIARRVRNRYNGK